MSGTPGFGAGGGAGLELIVYDFKLVAFRLDDFLGRFDLAAQRGFLHRRRHHVRGQRQIRRFEFEVLVFGERRVRFDQPPLAAKYVGRVRDVHSGLVEIEDLRRTGQAEFRLRQRLTREGAGGGDARQQLAARRIQILLGLPQCRLRGLQVRIGVERFGNQRVDLLGMEHLPPLARNIAAHGELLRRAAGNIGGGGGGEGRIGRVAADRRRRRRGEIRTHRARR